MALLFMVAFQAILVSFSNKAASIGTHINALVSIGVWGFGDVVWG
ncbi:hypothetical protein CSC48_1648 [Staphylococcus aureus]|nr:hypothetical protein CSC48_1648 [Staphylococcus aureus]